MLTMKNLILIVFCIVTTGISAQNVEFTGTQFKDLLIRSRSTNTIARNLDREYFVVDQNNDHEIQISEAEQVWSLDFDRVILNVDGIESFINIRILNTQHAQITDIDVSQMPYLKILKLLSSGISNLDLTQNPILKKFHCTSPYLDNLDLSQNPLLEDLLLNNSSLVSLDLSLNLLLEELALWGGNDFVSLDLSNNINLRILDCAGSFNTINLAGCENLTDVDLSNSNFINLDFSECSSLDVIDLRNNPLETLNIKNGTSETSILLRGTIEDDLINLNAICTDVDDDVEDIISQ